MRPRNEFFIAHGHLARIWPISGVWAQMNLHRRTLCEWLWTKLTSENILFLRTAMQNQLREKEKLQSVVEEKTYLYGLSPVWSRMWLFKELGLLNFLPQIWHISFFSPVWLVSCRLRSVLAKNAFPQNYRMFEYYYRLKSLSYIFVNLTPQTCFRSSKWIFIWILRHDLVVKNFEHIVHWCSRGTSIKWVWRCEMHNDFVMKRFWHTLHSNGLRPRWRFSWSINPCLALNRNSHIEHLNSLSELWVFMWIVK